MRQQLVKALALIVAIIVAPVALTAVARLAQAATPLNDLGSGLYLDQFQGGLYPGGSNAVPMLHAAEGITRAAAIRPLDTLGQPAADGKFVLVSIGMSNTSQEFVPFINQATAHPDVNHDELVIVNGAQGGKPAQSWTSPNAATYNTVAQRLAAANVTEAQVTAVWLKQANPSPQISLPDANADAFRLLEHLGDIVRAAKVRYPNLQVVLLSSRIYAGYATTTLNPEPYAYESGLAVKWLIEAQINQMNGGNIDHRAGDLDYTSGVAPWLAWGPYLWADGLNPRSDGLIWERSDLANDGTHPSPSGAAKVATMLMDFMLHSPFTQPWFLAALPGDYNHDGTVAAADYVVWRKNPGGNYTPDDYATWRANFGSTFFTGSGASSSLHRSHSDQAVPEPSTLLLCFGSLAVLWRRRGLVCASILAAAVGIVFVDCAEADTFGSGANTFDIEFVSIGNPGNAPDDVSANPDFAGLVPYTYRIGKFEISEQMIDKANAEGGLGITKNTRGADKPATRVSWNEAMIHRASTV